MSSEIDSALATYLAPFVTGRRVLYVGDADAAVVRALGGRADAVRVLDTGEGERKRAGQNVRVTPFRGGTLAFPEGSFDVAIVASAERLGDERLARVGDLARIVGDAGLVVVAHGPFEDAGHYEATYEALAARFEVVHVVGRAEVFAHAFAALDDGVGGVVVDGSLLEEAPPAYGYVFLCASVDVEIDGYALVQTAAPERDVDVDVVDAPRGGADEEALEALSEHCESLEAELDDARRKLAALGKAIDAERAERDDARGTVRKLEKELAALRTAEARRDHGVTADELKALERRLEERAERVRELEAEVERRGALVRELIEAGADVRATAEATAALDALSARAQAAEAARVEAMLTADELRARLAELTTEGDALRREREAKMEGRERGLRARVAELEEVLGLTSARLALAEADLDAAAADRRRLLAEQEHMREELELALLRSRGRMNGEGEGALERLRASERELSVQVGHLGGQLLLAREHESELRAQRDLARAEAMAFVAQVTALETETKEVREHVVAKLAAALAGTAVRAVPESGEGPTALDAELEKVAQALDGLRGERDGLRARLVRGEMRATGTLATRFESDASNALADELRSVRGALDAEVARVREKDDAIATRDALVTRLQLELARSEQLLEDLRDRVGTLGDENGRLRNAVVGAASTLDERDALERRIEELSRALEDARADVAGAERRLEEDRLERRQAELDATTRATRYERERDDAQARSILLERERDEARAALEDTRRILGEARALGATAQAPSSVRGAALEEKPRSEQDADDRDTMLRTLTSQLEERNDRIRALERRLTGIVPSAEDDELLKRELLELKERTARYADELRVEREARQRSERELEAHRVAAKAGDRVELEARLRAKAAENDALRADAMSAARDVEMLRSVFAEARQNLESIAASVAPESETAGRIGTLLTLLGRF